MRLICSISLLIFSIHTLYAVKAPSYPIRIKQPDGQTIEVFMHGDEFFRYCTTADGKLIAKGGDGYFRYAVYGNGTIRATGGKVSPSPLAGLLSFQASPISESEIARMREAGIAELQAKGGRTGIDLHTLTVVNILVIPVEFSDKPFSVEDPKNHFTEMLNTAGYTGHGGTGSAKDYFEANIHDREFFFDVTDVVTLPKPYSYYGANDENTPSVIVYDKRLREMVSDACFAVNKDVNFTKYDNDKNGQVDYIFLYFAGYNEAESGDTDAIWPQTYNIINDGLMLDGVKIGMFGCTSELMGSEMEGAAIPAGIGTFCHEFSHGLGLMDLYDVNYSSGGKSKCLWEKLSIMDEGNYNNNSRTPPYFCAIDRELAGILTIQEVKQGQNILTPIARDNKALIVQCSSKGEYYLFENRQEEGWDAHIGGSGMVVYHIDKSSTNVNGITAAVRWQNNLINTCSDHECADLVEAYYDAEHISQIFFPGQAFVTEFSPSTTPAFIDWNGDPVGFKLSDIQSAGEDISFNISEDNTEVMLLPENLNVRPYQKTAVAEWDCKRPGLFKWGVEWGLYSEYPAIQGKDSIKKTEYVIKNIDAFKDYFLRVYYIGKTSHGDTAFIRFNTTAITSPYPYINIPSSSLYQGDYIDLVIGNLNEETKSIRWFVNGMELYVNKAVFNYAGDYELEAVIKYASDNSEEVITRTVTIHEALDTKQ